MKASHLVSWLQMGSHEDVQYRQGNDGNSGCGKEKMNCVKFLETNSLQI